MLSFYTLQVTSHPVVCCRQYLMISPSVTSCKLLCLCVSLLQRCDPALLDPCGDSEQPDCAEAARVVLYLTVC